MKSKLLSVLRVLGIIVVLFVALFPLAWMVITSCKSMTELLKIPVTILPENFTLNSYYEVWVQKPFPRYIWNSLKISVVATLLGMIVSSLAAYGFAKFRFPFKKGLLMFVLVAQMFPGTSVIIPLFSTYKSYGLYDSHFGLMLLYATISLAFSIWMMYGYFRSVPSELEEAARIDGCSALKTFVNVILPISKPGIAAVGVYAFMCSWNEYLYSLILLTTESKYTISLGLSSFITEFGTYWNQMGAASIIVTIPTLLIFILLGKNLIAGLTAGAVKG
ncbi:carbohydrate ABC transporter permease [Diplocloster agilis]|uniref:Carbohydrate ABC transporter permease n=1 Tax=Diplocloster agilis TaxID=2850323 RepID=A0A949JZM7_9FIRM|nr:MULTISPECIES: carbohydrate ABC transporter permease [Lachnospiraceae]MBU9737519.1 carbohydrate ABC transporter permease [Diplocloster agilis]MBU9744733.1 carbohydrate ABC transporter permease [Diplocloster agilis]MCU6734707.1 carbohydrate ABC transporter permease [Suonthocola fibrivorans]SCJ50670.1 Inner membrane ABC transporter permease protein ycjP [uncultured Clostridium sp.]